MARIAACVALAMALGVAVGLAYVLTVAAIMERPPW
jgi:uncharacterized protein HemX